MNQTLLTNIFAGIKLRKPELHELDLLGGKVKTVHVIDSAAHKWDKLATRLYFKFDDIKRIEKDYSSQAVNACRQVMGEWLGGKGREPVTWATLIKVLNEAGLSQLSADLEDILDDCKH